MIKPHVPGDHPFLRQPAAYVGSVNNIITNHVCDMLDTMRQHGGIGLAAPQRGVWLRIAVLQVPFDDEIRVLINPMIHKTGRLVTSREGCLTFPGLTCEIRRSSQVRVSALNEFGIEVDFYANGLLAFAIQHEVDHLNGILCKDKAERYSVDRKTVNQR